MNMFGPNTYIKSNDKIDYSHRDKEFIELFSRVRDKFIDTFKLHEYDILFIPGSGTLGVEAVVWSVLNRIRVVGHDGVFKSKWKRLTETHKKETISYEKLYCQLETSNSSIFEEEGCIVDAISSFPYYDIPKDTLETLPWGKKYAGQKQKWFIFRFTGQDSDINVGTENPEFSDWKWAKYETLVDNIVPFKRDVYKKIIKEFEPVLN